MTNADTILAALYNLYDSSFDIGSHLYPAIWAILVLKGLFNV